MNDQDELPVIRATYEFGTWLFSKVSKFPRDLRFSLGERIERQSLLVLEGLIRARYERDRAKILNQVNVELEILRFLLRMAHDLKALPIKAYGDASTKLSDIGQQVGGWRKSNERRDQS